VGGAVADPDVADPDTVTLRELARRLRDADEWTTVLLDAGDGLLCAART
jgi:predicted O-methyltransferase YrrM